jgi:aminoglycoside phosphotransferase (APT) family kinase protein
MSRILCRHCLGEKMIKDRTTVEVEQGLRELYGSGETKQASPRVSRVTLLGSGYETDVFAFSVGGDNDDAGEELVLRAYAGEGAPEKAAREFAAMGRLREAGYPVPRVLILQRDSSPFGRPFIIMERIHGASMEWSPPAGAARDERPRRQELQALFCRLLVQLHTLDGSDVLPDHPLARSRDPHAFVDHELSFLSALLSRLEGREPPSLRGALAWLGSRRSEVPCARLAVVHGDFHRNNILMRADGAAFVIDWSNVRLADYRSDVAWTRLGSRAAAQPDGGEAELRLYHQLGGRKVSRIEYFEVAACTLQLLSVLISLQFGAARQGMRPEAVSLMRRDASHISYVAAVLQERTGIKMPDLEDALPAYLA